MDKYRRLKGQKVTALFFIGCLLFNYPVLAFFNQDGLIFGIPILYIYIFISWAIIIGLAVIIIERKS